MNKTKKRPDFEHRAGDPPHRLTRTRRLTAQEAARDRRMRSMLLQELPPAPGSPAALALQLRALVTRLKAERRRAGLSLAELSERTGIDKAYLSRLETFQQANTTVETLRRVAEALGKELVLGLADPPTQAARSR
jgi:ribosome-binding protein aMBF1 (putative translation factor)